MNYNQNEEEEDIVLKKRKKKRDKLNSQLPDHKGS